MVLTELIRPGGVPAARIGNAYYTFERGKIVAMVSDWSSLGAAKDRGAASYSSYKGELVPVYDLTAIGGGRQKSNKLVIVDTPDGCIAVIADGMEPRYSGVADAIDLSALLDS